MHVCWSILNYLCSISVGLLRACVAFECVLTDISDVEHDAFWYQ